MKEFWNERYGQEEYAYGVEPNAFFKDQLGKINSKGNLLMPAEGEGRNAIYAAKQGFEVTAFDMSEEAKNKALQLTGLNNVEIKYKTGTLEQLQFTEDSFDAVGLIFAHFPAHLREPYHKHFIKLLKPGGFIILEGFSKRQLKYSSGGPKNLEMLFSLENIKNDFSELDAITLIEEEIELNEGLYHKGPASVIRFVGEKASN